MQISEKRVRTLEGEVARAMLGNIQVEVAMAYDVIFKLVAA